MNETKPLLSRRRIMTYRRKVDTHVAGSPTDQYFTCYFLCFQRHEYLCYLSKAFQRRLYCGKCTLDEQSLGKNMSLFRVPRIAEQCSQNAWVWGRVFWESSL